MKQAFLHDGLAYWSRQTPDKIAVEMDLSQTLTFGELARWSDAVAARLADTGVRAGDRVMVIGVNSLAFIASTFGVLKAGGVIVPINDRYTAPEVRHFIEFTEPAAIVGDAQRCAMVRDLGMGVPLIDLADVEALRGGPTVAWRPPALPDDALAMIVFTSGSTGTPKGVMLSHADHLGRYLEMTTFAPELGPDTRSMMPMGLQGAPGTAWGCLFTSVIGGTFYCNSRYSAEKTLATLIDRRITFFNAVPLIYKEISQLPGFAGADLSDLVFARCGGAKLPRETWGLWDARGVAIRTLYGQSEFGGGALIATREEARAKPESCGRGMPFTELRVLRADGTACEAGEPGAVVLRGPGMMVGYWRNPEATAATIVNGWLQTGDVGVIDADGDFFFVDRAKELVKCGGFNVSPQEIENVLLDLELLDEVAIFPVPDERYGEVPFALIVPRAPTEKQAIFDHCRARLANFKLPRYIEFLDDRLPRLLNGKVDKQTLKKAYVDAADRFAKVG